MFNTAYGRSWLTGQVRGWGQFGFVVLVVGPDWEGGLGSAAAAAAAAAAVETVAKAAVVCAAVVGAMDVRAA